MTDSSDPERLGSGFVVESTSLFSADVSPIILRASDTVRLVLKPQLVRNNQEPDASVHGVLCYQRKLKSGRWEDADAEPLSSLKAGEGVRIDIKSAEILKLYRGLESLYETVRRDGIPGGSRTYIPAERGSLLADVDELLRSGDAAEVLKTFVRWARQTDQGPAPLRSVDGQLLVNFDAAIGVARLEQFLAEARDNLTNGDEGYWQRLLEAEPWVISQLYAAPMVILVGQAYVGGKSIQNAGGSIVDFMYRNALSQNSLIVEIKTPTTQLLTANEYRNGIHGPSAELGGATQQLLHARQTLQEDYLTLTARDDAKFNIFGTKALLIIGTMPTSDRTRTRSFEIYRNAQRGIEIVTFDELIAKAELLLDALAS